MAKVEIDGTALAIVKNDISIGYNFPHTTVTGKYLNIQLKIYNNFLLMLKLISCKGLLTLKEIEKIASNTIMWLSLTLKHSTKPFPKTILFLWSSISLLAATVLDMRLNTKRLELISRMKAQK